MAEQTGVVPAGRQQPLPPGRDALRLRGPSDGAAMFHDQPSGCDGAVQPVEPSPALGFKAKSRFPVKTPACSGKRVRKQRQSSGFKT